jgi:hypothetical protein
MPSMRAYDAGTPNADPVFMPAFITNVERRQSRTVTAARAPAPSANTAMRLTSMNTHVSMRAMASRMFRASVAAGLLLALVCGGLYPCVCAPEYRAATRCEDCCVPARAAAGAFVAKLPCCDGAKPTTFATATASPELLPSAVTAALHTFVPSPTLSATLAATPALPTSLTPTVLRI